MTHDTSGTTGPLDPAMGAPPSVEVLVPTLRDRYRLMEKIGEGGFGVVYRAEQIRPVRREVAIKVIKPGLDSKTVVSRFEAERQALALMDHPNVAKVFDGGLTDEGRPFFAMELVRGEPITEHCDRQRLNVRSRVGLMILACEAIQHAHHKGVIHRDLKPSNVLVAYESGKATVKVIDFGVAKALNQRLTDATIFTGAGQMIGTPEYMSPEQAEMTGSDIDTRSDVYSLGVLLYELLTGQRPFDSAFLRSAALAEIQRIIRDVQPEKPSTRLTRSEDASAHADSMATGLHALSSVLRRDLDWVCMKCLEKDRERRYETVESLESDLRRFLADETVLAGPPSATYKLTKFAARNRVGMVVTAVMLALVAGGLFGTAYGLGQARQMSLLAEDAVTAQRSAESAAIDRGEIAAFESARADDLSEDNDELWDDLMQAWHDRDRARMSAEADRSLAADSLRDARAAIDAVKQSTENERTLIQEVVKLGAQLLAEEQFALCVLLLDRLEGPLRDAHQRDESDALANALYVLGSARARLARDVASLEIAEANLLDGYSMAERPAGRQHALAKLCAQSLADLYESWSSIDPRNDYVIHAERWRKIADDR